MKIDYNHTYALIEILDTMSIIIIIATILYVHVDGIMKSDELIKKADRKIN